MAPESEVLEKARKAKQPFPHRGIYNTLLKIYLLLSLSRMINESRMI
jgi:hypothetical protein